MPITDVQNIQVQIKMFFNSKMLPRITFTQRKTLDALLITEYLYIFLGKCSGISAN